MSLREKAAKLKTRARHEFAVARCVLLHPDTPWWARAWLLGVLAYALNPLDLIPDFIPVLGYLDDLVLIPLGLWVAWRMAPPHVQAQCRARAWEEVEGQN
ncbi:MAG: DUF1232 domain-containing protein [Candidatus Cloacimonetes bacterium]|nr:DUF1232 domain-containing protein [Candidatus Cloacimonadota bacterium]